MPQKYALRTGRKFKNIDPVFEGGKKRGSHWSIKPELNFRELEFEEDAEKVKLDQNYKAFVEDDDIQTGNDKQDVLDEGKFIRVLNQNIGRTEKRSKLKSSKQIKFKRKERKNLNLQGKRWKKENKAERSGKNDLAKSNRKVIVQKQNFGKSVNVNAMDKSHFHQSTIAKSPLTKVELLDSSAGQGSNRFTTADIKSNIQPIQSMQLVQEVKREISIQTEKLSKVEKEENFMKRSIENDMEGNLMSQKNNQKALNDAVMKARMAVNNLQNRQQGVGKVTNRPGQVKTAVLGSEKLQHYDERDANGRNKLQQRNLQQRSLQQKIGQQKTWQESRNQAMRLLRNSVNPGKGPRKSGELGDEPSKKVLNKMKNLNQVQSSMSPSNHVKERNVNPMALRTPTQPALISQRAKIESPRADIEKPKESKEKMKIMPANVARAVAMAMEQLKRDRMWGKVFVHVLPSGKLKVMVQETKKMPDE